jgi:hypothetical protein
MATSEAGQDESEATVQELIAVIRFLGAEIRELAASRAALQALVVSHGLVSWERLDEAQAAALRLWDEAFQKELQASNGAKHLRLLERLDSKPQPNRE